MDDIKARTSDVKSTAMAVAPQHRRLDFEYSDATNQSRNMEAGPKSLLDYATIFGRHKRLLIVAACLGLALGYGSFAFRTKLYRVRTTMEFQELNQDVLNKHELDTTGEAEGQSYFATQIKILQSESLLDRVLASLKLEDQPRRDSSPEPLVFVRRRLGFREPSTQLPREAYRRALSKGLTIKPLEETRIVEIVCDYPDAEVAAKVVNTMVKEYMEQTMEERSNASSRTTGWLTRQIETLRVSLRESEDKLLSYGRAAGLYTEEQKDNPAEEKLRRAETERDRAQADRVIRQSRYEAALTGPISSVPEVVDDPALRDYQSRLADLRRQMADLQSTLMPGNPKVVKVQAQIQELEALVETQRASVLDRLRKEFDVSTRREKLLSTEIAAAEEQVSLQAGNLSQYQLLKREVDSNRQLYESMLQRVKEYGIAVALPTSQVRVVDKATPSSTPYSPSLPSNLALGLAGAWLCVGIRILVKEHKNPTFVTPGEAAVFLNVAELGAIPTLKPSSAWQRPSLIGNRKDAADLEPKQDAKSLQIGDSIRTALVSILSSPRVNKQLIAISSPGPGEGKTTTTSNLGIALAETGRRVLLVDGDLRRPKLHVVFGKTRANGLADLLQNDADLTKEELASVVRKTEVPRLSLLSAGSAGNVSDLLYSAKWHDILERLRSEYDTVLIDTPPLLNVPDARIIGKMADAMVLVISAKSTVRSHAVAARTRLELDGIPLLGLILNHWDPEYAGYSSYSAYEALTS